MRSIIVTFIFPNAMAGNIPRISAKSERGTKTNFSRVLTSFKADNHSSPPIKRVCPKNIRCKVHKKYAALSRIPTDPPKAIHLGSSPFMLPELNAPIRLNASAMKAEKPGSPDDAKKAIITKAVNCGIIKAKPLKFGIYRS